MDIILSALAVFVSTSIDYLIVLTILFSTLKQKHHYTIYLGQYIGTGILVGVSLLAAYYVQFVPEEWMIGLLGLIPLGLGIRAIFVDEDVDEDEIKEKFSDNSSKVLAVIGLTLALGGDNLGIYIPYFAGMDWSQVAIVLVVFVVGIYLLCYLSMKLASVPMIDETVERYEKIIVPIVFIGLGIYILWENGTIQYLLGMG